MERAELEALVDAAGRNVDRDEVLRLLDLLVELGATDDELQVAAGPGGPGAIALELVLRGPGPLLPFAEAAAQAGMTFEEGARIWRAFGFPDPTPESPQLGEPVVEALQTLTGADEVFGTEATLALARVLGSTTARLGQAIVDAFRVEFETPQLQGGMPYSELMRTYTTLASEAVPALTRLIGVLLSRHLVLVASGAWTADAEGSTAQRDLLVGFADLVGYTALSRTITPKQLAQLVRRFEDTVNDVVTRNGGQVVKLVGDGAMFVHDDADAGCRAALEIVSALGEDADLPAVRVGLAAGGVTSLHGDYFGEVVNLSARLVAVAPPSSVVCDEVVRERVGDGFAFKALEPQSLKGFGAPSTAYEVLRR